MESKASQGTRALVFVHGYLGFSEIHILGRRFGYFRGLREALADFGVPVYFPKVAWAGSIEQRAQDLARFLSSVPEREIYLIGHSMGGLDGRYLIHHLDPEHRVRALVTVCTPHRGSLIADWAFHSRSIVAWILRRIGRPGLDDLRVTDMEQFNKEVSDRADVAYRSFAGVRTRTQMPRWWRYWHQLLQQERGDNDGLVNLSSARWGEFRETETMDHVEATGWNLGWPSRRNHRPFKHIPFYRGIVEELLQREPEETHAAKV
jgi:triacylglycerol lipase